jgi:hypothetical protein
MRNCEKTSQVTTSLRPCHRRASIPPCQGRIAWYLAAACRLSASGIQGEVVLEIGDRFTNSPGKSLLPWLGVSTTLTLSLFFSSMADQSRLGASQSWSWLLTGLQVLALWAAGTRRTWGWPLGASVQPPWIAYAIVTGQLGFIPGCAVSGCVQAHSYLRARRRLDERSPVDVSAFGASRSVPRNGRSPVS